MKWIFNRKLTELTPADLDRIGIRVYSILVRGKELMDIEIKCMANIAPTMLQDPSWEFADHKRCVSTWKSLWREQIG